MALARIYSRYFCEEGHRVFPYDSLERLTEAPVEGRNGKPVLLSSANAHLTTTKFAWCFACDDWTEASRRTQHAILLAYINRNVTIRSNNGHSDRAMESALRRAIERKDR